MGGKGSKGMEVAKEVPEPIPFPDYTSKQAPHWSLDSQSVSQPVLAASGLAASEPRTITQAFRFTVAKHKDEPALKTEFPCPPLVKGEDAVSEPLEKWKTWTWQEYHDESFRFGKSLIAAGHEKHDAVVMHGFNSPQFVMAMLGTSMAGGKLAGLYATDTTEQIAYKTKHSDASVVALQENKAFSHIEKSINDLPYVKAIVMWEEEPSTTELTREDGTKVAVYTWKEFLEFGDKVSDAQLEERINGQQPGECAALIYTSGTTGMPKAVMISHDNILYVSTAVVASMPEVQALEGMSTILSYLPLSHVAGLLMDVIGPIELSGKNDKGAVCTCFARKYDLSSGALRFRLQAVSPAMFLGVPRVWEKISESLRAKAPTGIKAKLGAWAKRKALAYAVNCQMGGTGIKPPQTDVALNKVLMKVKQALGLTKMVYGVTGAAPIQKDTVEYFASIGISINETYGMSECAGSTTISSTTCRLWGTVGYALPGCEVKIFQTNPDDVNDKKECPPCENFESPEDASQGEICFRGRHIMMGYLANPKLGEEHMAEIAKKNAEAIDAEGWLHSGDMGCIYKGMVRVTGRYKELIIGAGGENIAPVPIEDGLKKLCPAISNVMMIGDKRKYNIAFITLKTLGATGELPGTDALIGEAKYINPSIKTISEAVKDEEYIKVITDAIIENNKNVPNNASKIQRFTIMPRDFSVVTGELTPTLKLKRSWTTKQYGEQVDLVYAPEDMKTTFVPWTMEIGGVEHAEAGEASKVQAAMGVDAGMDEEAATATAAALAADGEKVSIAP